MKDTELVAEVFKRAENYFEEQKKLCAITELEKLKVKVIALSYDCKIATIDRYEVEKLIDGQIAELKGKQE